MICGKTSISGAFVVFVALALLLLTSGASALSNSGGGSWQYNKEITINNPGTGLSDYQVMVTLDSSNFLFSQAQANGEDIKFTDAGGAELPYWIETWNSAGKSAKVWVKMANIPVGRSTIHMYWGNPSATSSSNGTNTFVFFDDFLTLDSNVWDQYTSAPSATITLLSPSIVELRSNGPERTQAIMSLKKILPANAFIKMKVAHTEVSNAGENGEYDIIEFENLSTGRKFLIHYRGEDPNVKLFWRSEGGPYSGPFSSLMTSFSRYNTDPHTWTIIRTTEPRLKVIRNDKIIELDTTSDVPTAPFNGSSIQSMNGWDGSSSALQFDYFFVGKYASSEPSVSLGSEQPNLKVPSLTLAKSASPSTITEGDTTTITIRIENTGSDAKNIKIVDAIPQGFTLVSGLTSQEYTTLKATEYRTFQYTIKAIGTGRFVTDLATVTYQDDKGNSYSGASNSVTITVQAPTSALPQPNDPKSIPGFEAIAAIIGLFLIFWRRKQFEK